MDRRYREVDVERQKALSLQATEYERRLETLNHAHQEAQRVAHTYITLDKWEDNHSTLATRVEVLENWRARATGAAVVLTMFAGAVGAAIVKVFGG